MKQGDISVLQAPWDVEPQANVDHRPCGALLWPLPHSTSNGTDLVLVNQDFTLSFGGSLTETTPEALLWRQRIVDRIENLRRGRGVASPPSMDSGETVDPSLLLAAPAACLTQFLQHGAAGSLSSLVIDVSNDNERSWALDMDTDESYTLTVASDQDGGAVLEASSVFGALHGLATFEQLLFRYHATDDTSKEVILIADAPWEVEDAPRFRHRGMLVDTSRQFLSLETVKENVRYMSAVKMNVLHWHIADSESFPLELESVPELSASGSYGSLRKGLYSAAEVEDLITYAAERGVRVVPEVDTPAHAYSWSYAYPELVTCADAQPNWEAFCGGPPCGQLDPTQNATFDVVHRVMGDLGNMFADPLMHLGYDEVNGNCWLSSKNVRQFMYERNYTDWTQLLQYYLDNQLPGLPQDRVPMFWEDVVDDGMTVPENSVIQIWSTTATLADMLANTELRLVLSNSDGWYLDCGAGNWVTGGPSWCDYSTWQDIYLNEPFQDVQEPVPESYLERTLGGEVCVWGDKISDSNQIPAAWPRTAAAAERLWSRRDVNDTATALPRLLTQAARFGSSVEALTPFWCLYNPSSCLDPIQLRP